MSDLLAKSLERDQNVDLAIKNSYESFINENEKTAKSLVMYLDDQFKKEFKNNTEVDISEKIGTYETSILPYEDCCTIFVAKHPVTKPNVEVIRKSEENLSEKIDELFAEAVNTVETIIVK